jgi:hypothetical protein
LLYSVRHLDHCCYFIKLPPGAVHFPETTEPRDIKYNVVCCIIR